MHQHLIKSSETNLIVLLIQPGPGMPGHDFFFILWEDNLKTQIPFSVANKGYFILCIYVCIHIWEYLYFCKLAIELKDSNSLLHGSHRLQSQVSLFGFVTYTGHCPRLNIIKADLSWQKHRVIIQRWQNNVTTGQYVSYHDKAWSFMPIFIIRCTKVDDSGNYVGHETPSSVGRSFSRTHTKPDRSRVKDGEDSLTHLENLSIKRLCLSKAFTGPSR